MPTELKKGLGLVHVFAIASGAMISSGLFILPGMAHAEAGPGVIFSYLLAGILATAGALSIAELTTAMPKAGGDYFFIMRGFGPGVGTVAGVLSWFSLSLKSAFAIVGMATFAALVVNLHGLVAGPVLCVLFVVLNLVGVREAARAQVVLVAGLFALLALYIVAGLGQVRSALLIPFAPYGLGRVFWTTGFVFVSYGGLLNVASVAEEVRRPGRTIPLGLALSLVSVTLIYTLAVVVTSGVLETETLDGSLTPLSDGGRAILGEAGYIAMSVGAVLAFVSTANAGIMAASRYLLALSRDRLLPRPLAKVNRRFRTPHAAILVTGAVIVLSLFLKLDILVEAASTVLILGYMLACLSVIVLRESGLQNYRPAFRAPVYPWLQIGGIAGLGFVLFEMGVEAYGIAAGLILVGFLAFWFYGRKRVRGESALLHLLERLTDRQLATGSLEAELKTILHERDAVVLDRFDRLVEQGVVLDVGEPMDADAFFRLAAEHLAPRLDLDPGKMAGMLRRREDESSTLLSASLAVPHVVVPGEERFDLLMARARRGVRWSDEAPEVKTIFLLAGTRDERNFHLRALAAIAQIVQEKDFERRWLAAKNEQGLRDVALLSSRKRHAEAEEDGPADA
jgi:amino acid transporter/mannitol/fructose-specific phosphotransferase system IIA component (Ntr-type)